MKERRQDGQKGICADAASRVRWLRDGQGAKRVLLLPGGQDEDRTRLVVDTDNEFAPESADHWDIRIPEGFVGRGNKRRLVVEYGYVLEVAKRLRKKPGLVRDEYGDAPCGDQCAGVLEQGVKAAKRQRIRTITIDWF